MPTSAFFTRITANLISFGESLPFEINGANVGRSVQRRNAHVVIAESNFPGRALSAEFGDFRRCTTFLVLRHLPVLLRPRCKYDYYTNIHFCKSRICFFAKSEIVEQSG